MVWGRISKRRIIVWGLIALLAAPVYAGSRILGPNVQVTDDGLGRYADAGRPDVAMRGSAVYAVWEDNRETLDSIETDIYFAKSTDGGATWGDNIRVNDHAWRGLGLHYPAIAVGPEGNIYVAWYLGSCFFSWSDPTVCGGEDRQNDVHLARSTDGGNSFETIWLWDGGADSLFEIVTPLAVDPTNGKVYTLMDDPVSHEAADVYLVGCDDPAVPHWDDSEWWQVRVNDSSGSGRIYDWDDGPLMALAARNGVVCAAWEDRRGGNAIYGACSTDGGRSFGSNFAISGANATNPHLALGPHGTLYAAYQVDEDIYLRSSADHGTSWSGPVQVTDLGSGLDSLGWDLAVDDNGTVAIVWTVASGGWGYTGDLYLSTSIDGGNTFTVSPSTIEDGQGQYPNVAAQYHPAIAVSGSGDYARAVMVWRDDRNTQDQIWSARAELDATPPTAPANLRAIPGDTVVDLSWSPSTDRNGIAGYYIIRATTSGGPYTVINPFPITGTSYRDVGLGSGAYYYKVYAVDGTGNIGPASNEVSAAANVGGDLPLNGTIAYEAGSDIRLRDLPHLGDGRTLAQGLSPHFAPDGNRVYYYHSDAILSRPVGGGNAQTHYTDSDLIALFDLPDDVRYFARVEEQFYAGTQPGQWCYAYEPHYGPFGGGDIYVATSTIAQDVTISADRQWLAYTTVGYCGPAAQGQYGKSNLCLVNLSTQAKTCYSDANYQDPNFAPSGHGLLFAADFSGQYEIWKAQVQGDGSLANLTQLTRSDHKWSLMPAWSSDGNWAIFVRGTPSGDDIRFPDLQAPRLHVVRADGASLRALGISGQEPAWHGGGPAGMNHRVYLPLVRKSVAGA